MTYEDAIEFFYKYGNVGFDKEQLKNNKPTESQLRMAVSAAKLFNYQEEKLAEEAASAIGFYWQIFELLKSKN